VGFLPYFGGLPGERRRGRDLCFNPVPGFLPTSAVSLLVPRHVAVNVSIPVLGFLPASTSAADGWFDSASEFQSRSGFYPCFGLRRRARLPHCAHVSIPFWVFSLLRLMKTAVEFEGSQVSIPFWVFSLLRPMKISPTVSAPSVFQSRSGFSLCFDLRGRF